MASAGSSKGLSDRAGPSRGGASIALERALQPTTKRVSARQEARLIAEVQNILHKGYELEKERIPGVGIIRDALEGAGWVAAAAVGDLVNAGFVFGSESGEEWERKPAVVASSQKAPPAAKHLPSALKLRGNAASVDTSGSKFINGGPLDRKPEPSGAGGGGRGSAAGAGAGTTPLALRSPDGKASAEGAGREDDAHTAFSFHSPTKKKSGSIRKDGGRDGGGRGARRLQLLSPASSSGEQSPPPGPTSVLAPAGAGGGSRSTGAGGGSGSPNAARSLFGHEAEDEDENCINGITTKQPTARSSARKKAPSASSTTLRAGNAKSNSARGAAKRSTRASSGTKERNARLPSPIRADMAAGLKQLALKKKNKALSLGRPGEPHDHPIADPPTLSDTVAQMPWQLKRTNKEQGKLGNRGRVAKKQRTEGVDEATAKTIIGKEMFAGRVDKTMEEHGLDKAGAKRLIGQEQIAAARAKAREDPSSSNLKCPETAFVHSESSNWIELEGETCGHVIKVGDKTGKKQSWDLRRYCSKCKREHNFHPPGVVEQQKAASGTYQCKACKDTTVVKNHKAKWNQRMETKKKDRKKGNRWAVTCQTCKSAGEGPAASAPGRYNFYEKHWKQC